MGLYGLAAASGPALAPVVSGYAVVANGWRWAFWIMLWLSGSSLLLLGFTMPEVGPSANSWLMAINLEADIVSDFLCQHPIPKGKATPSSDRKQQHQVPRRDRLAAHDR